jgi:hypothetical protein
MFLPRGYESILMIVQERMGKAQQTKVLTNALAAFESSLLIIFEMIEKLWLDPYVGIYRRFIIPRRPGTGAQDGHLKADVATVPLWPALHEDA